MKYSAVSVAVIATLIIQPCVFAATPAGLVAQTTDAVGGMKAFHTLGVIQMDVSQVETYADNTQESFAYTAYIDTSLANSRFELPGQVVNVRNGDTGWATVRGTLDVRQQTPRIAPGFNRQRFLPLLFPFSLDMKGVVLDDSVDEVVFAKEPALKFSFTVPEMFFASPLMGLQWDVVVDPDNHEFIAARFLPVEGFSEAKNEGLQIEITETVDINGVKLPSKVLMTGINRSGQATGMKREVTIETTVVPEPSPALFLHPEKLDALEEG